MTGLATRLGTSTDFGGGTRAGVTLLYDYYDFRTTSPVAFNSISPWDTVQRYGAAFPVTSRFGDDWVLGVAPSVEWFKENGARSSDALTWGATFSAVRLYPGGNRLGLGLAAFDRIEDTSLVPFLIVDWRLGDRWRLINPLPSRADRGRRPRTRLPLRRRLEPGPGLRGPGVPVPPRGERPDAERNRRRTAGARVPARHLRHESEHGAACICRRRHGRPPARRGCVRQPAARGRSRQYPAVRADSHRAVLDRRASVAAPARAHPGLPAVVGAADGRAEATGVRGGDGRAGGVVQHPAAGRRATRTAAARPPGDGAALPVAVAGRRRRRGTPGLRSTPAAQPRPGRLSTAVATRQRAQPVHGLHLAAAGDGAMRRRRRRRRLPLPRHQPAHRRATGCRGSAAGPCDPGRAFAR